MTFTKSLLTGNLFRRRRNNARRSNRRRNAAQVWTAELLEDRICLSDVALLSSVSPDWSADVVSKIEDTGLFTTVTAIDVGSGTPTVAELENYDSVLVYNAGNFADAAALGDNLADYMDGGYGVVTAVRITSDRPLGGRWAADGYDVIDPVGMQSGTTLTLGEVAQPGHPIMGCVTDFSGGSGSFHGDGELTTDSSLIASWSNDRPLAAENDTFAGRNVALNMFPVSSDIFSNSWDSTTDGAILMGNALLYALGGLGVCSTDPADGSTVFGSTPTQYIVNVTEPLDAATVDVGDFEVNGIPASGFSYAADSTSVTFTFATDPVTTQGLQTMYVAADAFASDSDGTGVTEFNGTFRFDELLMEVISTVPADGSIISLPFTTLDLNFNEPYDFDSAQPSDFTLNQGSVIEVSQVDDDTLRLSLEGLTEEGTWTVDMAEGAMTDVFGNPGAAYSGSYTLDFGVVPYPVPLTAKEPAGSLIYDPTKSGSIDPADDTDSFTILVDPGQLLTVVVDAESSLWPTVEVHNQDGDLLGSAQAGAAGESAVLQTVPTHGQLGQNGPPAKTYTVTVGGADGTTGGYTVQIILNAAVEEEAYGGPLNYDISTAQDLEPSAVQLHRAVKANSAGAQPARMAVIGGLEYFVLDTLFLADFESGEQGFVIDNSQQGQWHLSDGRGDQPGHSATTSFYFGQGEGPNGGGTYQTGSSAQSLGTITSPPITLPSSTGETDLIVDFSHVLETRVNPTNVDFAEMQVDDGSGFVTLQRFDRVNESSSWTTAAPVNLSAYAGQTIELRWSFDTRRGPVGRSPEGWYVDDVRVAEAVLDDYYSFEMRAGDSATIALAILSGSSADVTLLGPDGSTLALGNTGPTNVDEVISNFVATASGTHYLSVTGDPGTVYSLLATRNAEFDTEKNNDLSTAQDVLSTQVAGRQWVLGALTPPREYQGTAVAFDFEDISGTGTRVLAGADDSSFGIGPAQLNGFEFNFYDTNYTEVFASSNGLITFGSGNSAFSNRDLTTSPVQAAIAPLWDDLEFFSGGTDAVYWEVRGAGDDQRLILQWQDARFFCCSGDTITFQAVLFEADGSIQFNYLDLQSGRPGDEGARATVGVKDVGPQGDDRLLLAYNNGPNEFVGTGQSTRVELLPETDIYQVTLAGNQRLEVKTSTPGGGLGEFVNQLDPMIRLYDAGGNLIASDDNSDNDDRNASLAYKTPKGGAGLYYVEVLPSDATPAATVGEYVLEIKGGSGEFPAFQVTATDPADGVRARGATTQITVDFNDSILLTTVDASDLTINGLAATGVIVVDSDTLVFDLPTLVEGNQSVQIAAGAILDLQNTPLEAFDMTFYEDLTAPRVVGISIQEGDTIVMDAVTTELTYIVEFSEAMRADDLDPGDFRLRGTAVHNQNYAPASFGYDGSATTLTLQYTDLPEDSYTLTLLSGNGRFEDTAEPDGFNLDGEPVDFPIPPNESGDGDEGGNFFVNFNLDVGTAPYPTPLTPKAPLGSLIYDPSVLGIISPAGDTDTFTIDLDAGQTITVVVDPATGLEPTVELVDPDDNTVGSATGPAGQDTVLQTVPSSDGTFVLTVGGANDTTGVYGVQLILNAAVEDESHDGPINDTQGTAQDLDASSVALLKTADRLAALGLTETAVLSSATLFLADFDTGDDGFTVDNGPRSGYLEGLWHLSTGRGAQSGHSADTSFYYGSGEGPDGGGTYSLGTRTPSAGSIISPSIALPSLSQPGQALVVDFNYVLQTRGFPSDVDFASLAIDDGSGWTTLQRYDRVAESSVWRTSDPVDVTGYAGEMIQLRWEFDTQRGPGSRSPEGWYVDDVRVSQITLAPDYYSFSVPDGVSVTLALTGLAGSPNLGLTLEDNSGAILAVGSAGQSNVDQMVYNYGPLAEGTYYARVTGQIDAEVPYSLVVTRDAVFDREANDTFDTAQNFDGVVGSLGHVQSGADDEDWYSVTLTEGEPVFFETITPADGPGEFVNELDPQLEFYDPSGQLISGVVQVKPDGRNESIDYTPTESGLFRIRVSAENDTGGEYFLDPESISSTPGATAESLALGAAQFSLLSQATASRETADAESRLTSAGTTLALVAASQQSSRPFSVAPAMLTGGPTVRATPTGLALHALRPDAADPVKFSWDTHETGQWSVMDLQPGATGTSQTADNLAAVRDRPIAVRLHRDAFESIPLPEETVDAVFSELSEEAEADHASDPIGDFAGDGNLLALAVALVGAGSIVSFPGENRERQDKDRS